MSDDLREQIERLQRDERLPPEQRSQFPLAALFGIPPQMLRDAEPAMFSYDPEIAWLYQL